MRRLAIFTAPLVAAGWLLACEDDPSAGGGTILLPDSGGLDGNVSGIDANAPPPDAAGDAVADAPVIPLPVTVVATNVLGALIQNVTVVFQDADGAVIETKTTGADGKAISGTSPVPAMATVAFMNHEDNRELLTWTNVQGGDVLQAVALVDATLAKLQISLPGQYTGDGGPTTNYFIHAGSCGAYLSALEPVTIDIEPYCFYGAGAIMARGMDIDGNAVAYSTKKLVDTPTDGGTLAVTTDDWITPPTNVTVSISSTSDTSAVAWFTPIANGTAFISRWENLGDAFQYTFDAPPAGFADAYNASVAFTEDFTATRLLAKRVTPAGTIAFDANDLPVAITAAAVDATAPDRPVANWTGNMGTLKGGLVRLRWHDSMNDYQTRWSIVVPPNAAPTGTVKAPALPANLAAIVTTTADGGGGVWEETPDVSFVDSDLVPDYAAWKKIQGALFAGSARVRPIDHTVLPQNGNLKVTNYHPYMD